MVHLGVTTRLWIMWWFRGADAEAVHCSVPVKGYEAENVLLRKYSFFVGISSSQGSWPPHFQESVKDFIDVSGLSALFNYWYLTMKVHITESISLPWNVQLYYLSHKLRLESVKGDLKWFWRWQQRNQQDCLDKKKWFLLSDTDVVWFCENRLQAEVSHV